MRKQILVLDIVELLAAQDNDSVTTWRNLRELFPEHRDVEDIGYVYGKEVMEVPSSWQQSTFRNINHRLLYSGWFNALRFG